MAEVSIKELKQISLFSRLSRDDLKAVTDLFERVQYQAGDEVCRQGEIGRTAYLVESGELRVWHVDPEGIEQTVDWLEPGDFFGQTSLLLGEPRDATIEAFQDSTLLSLSKEDFDRLREERPGIDEVLQMRADVEQKARAPRFPWLAPEETVVLSLRKHKAMLVRDLFLPVLVLVAVLVGSGYWHFSSGGVVALVFGAFLALIPTLLSVYFIVDYRNDDYILTNRRVAHEERVFLLRASRAEAPLHNVENIQQVREGIWAQAFDLGDLIIETAGERGVVVFREIPHPDQVRDAILDQVRRTQALVRAEERAAVREALRRRFGDLPEKEPSEPEGPSSERSSGVELPLWLSVPIQLLRYFIPPLRYEAGDTITWRKHWAALIRPIWLPTLLIVAVTAVTILLLLLVFGSTSLILLGYGLVMIFLFPWWLWRFEDWRNDVYQVTSSRIIDVEQLPFGLHEERREARLDMIQNIELQIPGLIGQLLSYGSVTIETAGVGAFTFDCVRYPRQVQDEIFKRMEAFEERQRRQEAERRRDEMLDWFSVYDQIRHSTEPQQSTGPSGPQASLRQQKE